MTADGTGFPTQFFGGYRRSAVDAHLAELTEDWQRRLARESRTARALREQLRTQDASFSTLSTLDHLAERLGALVMDAETQTFTAVYRTLTDDEQASILALLRADVAATLLLSLPPEQAPVVLKQLIEPRACPTEDLEHLLRGVLRRCGLQEDGARSLGGVDALAAILEETGSQGTSLKDALVSGTEDGPNAASQLDSTLLLSAALVDMDPQDIVEMLGKADAYDVLVFLSAASPQVVEAILQALPPRRRDQLQEDLQEQLASGALPPSSRAALQQARRRVLQAAAKVERQG